MEKLDASLDKILASIKGRGYQHEVTYRCPICLDSGVQDIETGTVTTAGGVTVNLDEHPELHFGRPCKGIHSTGCAWLAWRSAQAPERKPSARRGKEL